MTYWWHAAWVCSRTIRTIWSPCQWYQHWQQAYVVCRRYSRVAWSTLSNAADRSSSVSIARLPSSSAIRMSDITLRMAVSVEWCVLYADCRSGINLLTHRYLKSWLQTSRYKDFDNRLLINLISDGELNISWVHARFLYDRRYVGSLHTRWIWTVLKRPAKDVTYEWRQ